MNNRAWKKARRALNLPVRIHDLKHTFGRRLRAAQVSLEDRQDLLGHKSSRITTHYSVAEVRDLITAANKVCYRRESAPTLTLINTQAALKSSTSILSMNHKVNLPSSTHSGKFPASQNCRNKELRITY